MDGIPLGTIPTLTLHEGVDREKLDVKQIVGDWLTKLQQRFDQGKFEDLADLFIENCWWRDIVALGWDFTSKHGYEAIGTYLRGAIGPLRDIQTVTLGGLQPIFLDIAGMIWIQSGFTFKNPHGEGRGLVRLANTGPQEWKAWIVFTQLESLDYQKDLEAQRTRNPAAVNRFNAARAAAAGSTTEEAESKDLQVLIIGAGQAGLALGARLEHMGLSTVLVDRHPRIGDSWRTRYESITLNTPTYTDHYPFLRLPENWPRWLRRDQVADFMEHYGQLMGLHVLLRSTVRKVEYVEASRTYRVEVTTTTGSGDDGTTTTTQVLTPRHVVLATGTFSDEPIVPEFPGQDAFQGLRYHTSQHQSAKQVPDLARKQVVVIGPGTSGHDVAQDFVAHGAGSVTLVQRHPIFSLSVEAMEAHQLSLWNLPGLSTEDADLVGNSIPLAVIRTMGIGLTKVMAAHDREMLDGLRRAGLALRTGDEGYGLADHQLIKGGHFYIDQGANQMIIDGRIRVRCCEGGVREFRPGGLVLADGTELDADVVVLATGYHRNIRTVERLVDPTITERMPDFGLLDQEQERAGWWRPTGKPGLWFMTGSFMWCRQFSAALALQIAAIEKGLNKEHYQTK